MHILKKLRTNKATITKKLSIKPLRGLNFMSTKAKLCLS